MTDDRERTIYGLFDTRFPERIRYVGQTVALSSRVWAHRHPGRVPNSRGPVVQWTREIGGERVGFVVLARTAHPDEAERDWIARLIREGHALLNVQEGGRRGGSSEANRAALRAAPRPNKRVGIEHHDHLLEPEQIPEIRRQLAEGQRIVDIARTFGVARQTINAIRDGRTWKHVPPEK